MAFAMIPALKKAPRGFESFSYVFGILESTQEAKTWKASKAEHIRPKIY